MPGKRRRAPTSVRQARFMSAIAHSAKFAREAGVPRKVGREFHEAQRSGKYAPTGRPRGKKRRK